MFTNKLKPSEFYFGQPAQNLLLNEAESETMIESSQSGPHSGSQKFELSQNLNSQDLFVETPGLNETVEHEIPKSAYDRYMHFNTFQQHAFPSKRCLQKTPSFSEVPDVKVQTNEEHSKKLDIIHGVVTEMLEVQKSLRKDMNSISTELVEQKKAFTKVQNLWDEKWSEAISAFKLAQNTVSDIKNLAGTTASELNAHKLEAGKFFTEEVPTVKQCLDNCVKENSMIMKQNLDKTLVEICTLRDQILGETHDMNHHLAVEVEKILCEHGTSVTKHVEECMKGLQETTVSTLHTVQEEVKKWKSGRNVYTPPYSSFNTSYNSHQFQMRNGHSPTILSSHRDERHLPAIFQPSSSHVPYNRNSFLNNTISVNPGDHGAEESFCDDIQFNIKRKNNSPSQIFQIKPYSGYSQIQSFPSYRPKLQPLDMNVGTTGPSGYRILQMNNGALFDNIGRNAYFPSDVNKFKPKRVKTESASSGHTSGEMVKNSKITLGSNAYHTMYPNGKENSNSKANNIQSTRSPSIRNFEKGYMLRSRDKKNGKENSNESYLQSVSTVKNVPILDAVDDDCCVIINEVKR